MYCVAIINIRGMEFPKFVYFILFQHCKAYLFFNERKKTINKGVLGCLPVSWGNKTDRIFHDEYWEFRPLCDNFLLLIFSVTEMIFSKKYMSDMLNFGKKKKSDHRTIIRHPAYRPPNKPSNLMSVSTTKIEIRDFTQE